MATKKNQYFTKIHEEAIIQYALSEGKQKKTRLYVDYIQPAFNEMVEKIVYTYKFNNLPNIEVLKDDCKIWLTTILDKYDPNKKSKAFSYFSVITKNWFIAKIKKNAKACSREVSYENLINEADAYPFQEAIENPYETMRERGEFFSHLRAHLEEWRGEAHKEKDQKVLEAITILFESAGEIEIFNKKAIYLYMREITGLNTKQIVSTLNRTRIKYRAFKEEWDDGEV